MDCKDVTINNLLDSIKKSSSKEAVLLESHPASPVLRFLLEKKIAPLNLDVSSKSPQRVNMLIGMIDFKYFFGGYISVFNLAKRLFREGYNVRMIIVDECPFEPYLWRQQIRNYEGLEDFFDYIEVVYAFNRKEIVDCSPKDVFIATSWWSAYVANDALKYINAERFIYLTQEYEPIFHDFGSLHVLAKKTYDFPHYAIFSTEILREYHRQNKIGLFKDDDIKGYEYSVALQNAIIKVDLDVSGIVKRKIKRLLFYARPEPHASRNLYEIGILALSRAIRKGYFKKDEWEFYGIGTVADVPDILIDETNNIKMKLLPKVSLNEYKKLLTQFDIGLSLMLSPHPSLVPIEMTSAGMVVVTNTFANKTRECLEGISPNFIATDPSIEGVEQALVEASKRVYDYQARLRGAKVRWSQRWEDSLNTDFMTRVKGFINQTIDASRPGISVSADTGEKRLARAFIKTALKEPDKFIDTISPDDKVYEMIKKQDAYRERASYFYFKTGRGIFQTIEKILGSSGKTIKGIDSFLELECGYGILTRFLVHSMDIQKIWVSDLDGGAVDFQKKYFNTNSFYFHMDISRVKFPKKYEVIYTSLLFSEIHQGYFERWLKTLFSILNKNGILIFSAKGDRSEIERMAGRLGINNFYILENAFMGCQDIYVVTKKYFSSLNGLCPNIMPYGYLDKIEVTADGRLFVGGWAFDAGMNSPAKEVNIYYDGELMGNAVIGLPRHDVRDHTNNPDSLFSGWEYFGKLPPNDHVAFMDEAIIAEVIGHRNTVTHLVIDETLNIADLCKPISLDKKEEDILMPADESISSGSIWDNSIEQYCKNNFKLYWETLTDVFKYQFRSITGDENLHYIEYTLNFIKENIGRKDLRGLFIGCMEGDPGPEVTVMGTGLCSRIEVIDIAEGLLKKQEKNTLGRGVKGIEYVRQDCNELNLEENAYDFIFAVGTVHHIEKLENLFDQINRGLKDNGLFMTREYVGPNRLQFTDMQLSIINEILAILPEKYRIQLGGDIKNICERPDINELIKTDPSESIRSQDILSAMKERLEIINMVYTGGTILHPLLHGIASNFEGDEDAGAILRLLIFFEKYSIQNNILPSDYIFCMAKKKKPI